MSKKIQIIDEPGEVGELSNENREYNSDGYILLYVKGDRVKVTGELELKSLAPLLMKALAEKMMK